PVAHGRLRSFDAAAVQAMPGVVAVIAAGDIPGVNDCGPVVHDDPILAQGELRYLGQPVFAVVARTRVQARRAAALAARLIDAEALPPVLTPQEAHARGDYVLPPMHMVRPDGPAVAAAIAAAPHRLADPLAHGCQGALGPGGQ